MCSTEAPSGISRRPRRRAGPDGPPKSTRSAANSTTASTTSSSEPADHERGGAGRAYAPRGGPGRSAAAPPPPGRRRSSRAAAGRRRHPSRYRRRQTLVLGKDRDPASAAQSGDERLGLDRLRPPLATERERQTDDDDPGRLALDDRTQLGHTALAADLLDHAERPRERAARVADGDARARAAVVERERLGAGVTHAESRSARRRAPRRGGSRPCRRRAPSSGARRLRRRRSGRSA